MSVLVGKKAPDFNVAAVLGNGEIVESFTLSDGDDRILLAMNDQHRFAKRAYNLLGVVVFREQAVDHPAWIVSSGDIF